MTAADAMPILGISPRNSYFTKANIAFALDALLQEQPSVLVFIPYIPDINNYLAYGYKEETARKKATAFGRSFRKTVHEICVDRHYSYADNGHPQAQVRIIDWCMEVGNSFLYKDSLAEIETLYQTNAVFKNDVREASLHSIQSRMNHDPSLLSYLEEIGIENVIDKARHYILSEIAFLNVAPVLFGEKHIDYVYHREWPIYENFIAGRYDGNHRPQLALRIVGNPLAA